MNETERIDKIESRLSLIEKALNLMLDEKEIAESRAGLHWPERAISPSDVAPAHSFPNSSPSSSLSPSTKMPPSFTSSSATAWKPPAVRPVDVARPVERAGAGNWLGAIGMVCFLFASAFIVKLAIDAGWLTPWRQVAIATLLGLALIAVGFRLLETDKAYASWLPGGGVGVLYLAVFGAHSWHGLISFQVALGGITLVSAICIWIYTEIRLDIYPLVAAIGSYAAPFLLGAAAQSDFTLYYMVACSIAFAGLSAWLETRLLAIVSAYLAISLTAWLDTILQNHTLLAMVLPFHFLIFTVSAAAQSMVSRKPLTPTEAWSAFPAMILFYACEYRFVEQIFPVYAPWISLVFAALLIGIYLVARRQLSSGELASRDLVVGFATVVVFHSLYLQILSEELRPWLLPLILVAVSVKRFEIDRKSGKNLFPVLALLAIVVIEYLRIASHLLSSDSGVHWSLLAFMTTASAYLFYLTQATPTKDSYSSVLLSAAHGIAILGLYHLLESSGSLAISASWLAYAIAVMAFGFFQKDAIMAKSALSVLGLSAAKALIFDAASAPTIVRILCLLITGAVLYGCGFLLRRIQAWEIKS